MVVMSMVMWWRWSQNRPRMSFACVMEGLNGRYEFSAEVWWNFRAESMKVGKIRDNGRRIVEVLLVAKQECGRVIKVHSNHRKLWLAEDKRLEWIRDKGRSRLIKGGRCYNYRTFIIVYM